MEEKMRFGELGDRQLEITTKTKNRKILARV